MGIEKWEGTVISPAEVLAQGSQRFSPLRTMGKFSMYPELLHRPSSGAFSIHGRFSFLCLPPKPFFTLHPKLLEQVSRRPGQHSHSPPGLSVSQNAATASVSRFPWQRLQTQS